MSPARRRLTSRILAGVATVVLLLGAIALYAQQTLFDSEKFSNRAVSVLDDEAVQQQISAAITDAAIAQAPNAVAARPLIESVASVLVRSPALQSLLTSGVNDLHRAVIEGDEDTVVVTLANIGVLLRQGLEAAAPNLAKDISRQLDVELTLSGDPEDVDPDAENVILLDLSQIANDLKILHWITLAIALAAAFGSIHFAPTRLAGIRRLGRSVAIGGVLGVIAWQVGRGIVAGRFEGDGSDAARAVYNAFLGDLRTWLAVLAGAGIVTTAGATSTRDPLDVAALAARTWDRVTYVPERTWLRIVRGLALIVAGLIVLDNRGAVIEITVVLIGAFVIYVGAAELMRLAAGAVEADRAAPSAAAEAEADLSTGAMARVALVGVVLFGGIVALGFGSNDPERPPLEITTCNGSVELCDRPLDEVFFAGTHNSMSGATYKNWFFAQHEKGIGEQLDAGYRALLLDPHYGVQTSMGVATDLEKDLGSRQKIEAGLGSEAVAAAEALRKQIGYDGGGETEVFLCHGFCEVGAIKAEKGFREVADFLTANPQEVVVMSIEDATTPEDTIAALEAGGLGPFIYRGPNGPPWPTLREMIESDQRLLIMAERDGGDPPWYRRQFAISKETPFSFDKPEELEARASCQPNRGNEDASFFLLNHWVDTSPAPRPTNAKVVNEKEFLLERIRRCERVRGMVPNIIAVDFFGQGDVVDLVRELNEEPEGAIG